MTRDEILSSAAMIFGSARITTTLYTGNALRPVPETILEVRGLRDSTWRPLGKVAFESTAQPMVNTHPRASLDDLRRAAHVFSNG